MTEHHRIAKDNTGIYYLKSISEVFANKVRDAATDLTHSLGKLSTSFVFAGIDPDKKWQCQPGSLSDQAVSIRDVLADQERMAKEIHSLLDKEGRPVSQDVIGDLKRHIMSVERFLGTILQNAIECGNENKLQEPVHAAQDSLKELDFGVKALEEISKAYEVGQAKDARVTRR